MIEKSGGGGRFFRENHPEEYSPTLTLGELQRK